MSTYKGFMSITSMLLSVFWVFLLLATYVMWRGHTLTQRYNESPSIDVMTFQSHSDLPGGLESRQSMQRCLDEVSCVFRSKSLSPSNPLSFEAVIPVENTQLLPFASTVSTTTFAFIHDLSSAGLSCDPHGIWWKDRLPFILCRSVSVLDLLRICIPQTMISN